MGENYGRTERGSLIGPYDTVDELNRELSAANHEDMLEDMTGDDVPTWLVIENTPGYMPDADEPAGFSLYADAVAYANELADQIEEQGYVCDRSWASSGNYYAIHCELPREATAAPDLGRYIAVERAEES